MNPFDSNSPRNAVGRRGLCFGGCVRGSCYTRVMFIAFRSAKNRQSQSGLSRRRKQIPSQGFPRETLAAERVGRKYDNVRSNQCCRTADSRSTDTWSCSCLPASDEVGTPARICRAVIRREKFPTATGYTAWGCSVVKDCKWYVARIDVPGVRRHELAHCNGWPRDHPGGWYDEPRH